jgi:hypothetical protein
MEASAKVTPSLRLPAQCPPVPRELVAGFGRESGGGVEVSQTACDRLTGLAQQMCYAVEYGISM